MTKSERKSVYDDLKKYDILAKEDSFIEVTEWTNGEGYDIHIDEQMFSLTHGQLEAINYLTKVLEYESLRCKTNKVGFL